MKSPELVETSKFLSFVLRHKPEAVGVALSPQGWVSIDDLLRATKAYGKPIERDVLDEIVFTNDKRRFAFSPDGLSIRANQGHSITVDLELTPQLPPNTLYHGSATRFIESIRSKGILKMNRQHVHLSADPETASRVGSRHETPLVLEIDACRMSVDGFSFFISMNGVWLTDAVPPHYISDWK